MTNKSRFTIVQLLKYPREKFQYLYRLERDDFLGLLALIFFFFN